MYSSKFWKTHGFQFQIGFSFDYNFTADSININIWLIITEIMKHGQSILTEVISKK